MCHAYLSLSIKRSVKLSVQSSYYHGFKLPLWLCLYHSMKKITDIKIGSLLIEILQKLHYVPRFESFMVADFRRMAFRDECHVVY